VVCKVAQLGWIMLALNGPVLAVTVGQPAPAISGPDLQTGEPISLEQLRGRVVLVDFWASWCAPCLHSLPMYEALRAEIGAENFEILAINVDEDLDSARRFLERRRIRLFIVHDDGTIATAYAPPTMPTSYLLDRNGVIDTRNVGFRPEELDALRERIHALLETTDDP